MSRLVFARFARRASVSKLVAAPLCVALVGLAGGCDRAAEVGTGGATSVPDVRLRVTELDDEDVATQPASEAISTVPVLTPAGQAIIPPDRLDEVPAEPATPSGEATAAD